MKQKEVRKKNYLGKLPSIKVFIKRNQAEWWIIGVFLLIVYGIKVFNVSISHDTEAIIAASKNLYSSWFMLGRFGLIFLKKILGTYVFNPYIASFLMVVSMLLNSMLWAYLFEWLSGGRKRSFAIWIFPSYFFTSMIMAEQSGFLLQAYEVNVALLLIGIAFLCLFYFFLAGGSIMWCLPAAVCCIIAFSAYQSLIPLFTAGAAMCFAVLYDRMVQTDKAAVTFRFCFRLIGMLAAVFLISFFIYQITNKAVQTILDVDSTAYLSEQIVWGTVPASECVYNIVRHIYRAVFGKSIFYNGMNLFVYFGILGYAALRIRKKEPCYIIYILAVLYCLLSPFLMTILMGAEPTKRTQILLPFIAGFFLQYLLQEMWTSRRRAIRNAGVVLLVSSIVCIMYQSMLSARLYYTQYVQYEEDRRVAGRIAERIEQLGFGEIPKQPVAFVGARKPQKNPSCMKNEDLELIGRSFFEVSYGVEHGTWVMRNFLVTQGYPYALPTPEESDEAGIAAQDMPSWPDEGCVAEKDGIIIVNLGSLGN